MACEESGKEHGEPGPAWSGRDPVRGVSLV